MLDFLNYLKSVSISGLVSSSETAMLSRLCLSFALLLPVALLGCGGGGGAAEEWKLAPISGVVKLKGTPMENPVVTFIPDKGPSAIGIGNEKGEFTLRTNGSKGAVVGKCKVTVTTSGGVAAIPPSDGNEMKLVKKAKLDNKYANPDSTDLIVEVPEAGNENMTLDLD